MVCSEVIEEPLNSNTRIELSPRGPWHTETFSRSTLATAELTRQD